MEIHQIQALCDLNNAFYRANHESFSGTRQSAWDGWKRVCAHVEGLAEPYRVLDVACGNMRFERFLARQLPERMLEFSCLDSCAELADPSGAYRYKRVDILRLLMNAEPLVRDGALFDMAVTFGFMHHVPTIALRKVLIRSMLESLKPGGIAAISFWKFAQDEKLAARAHDSTEQGRADLGVALEPGDYLMGWNAQPGVYRYCHSFDDGEIEEILGSVRDMGEAIERFDADGRNEEMNGYAILRRL